MATRRASARLSARLRKQVALAIAARLAPIKQAGELNQAEVGSMLGLSQSKVSELLRANAGVFSLDKLVDLAARSDLVVRISVTRPYGRE